MYIEGGEQKMRWYRIDNVYFSELKYAPETGAEREMLEKLLKAIEDEA